MKPKNVETKKNVEINIDVETKKLDEAIEKANRLIELLREAQQIIDSLSDNRKSQEMLRRINEALICVDGHPIKI